AGHHRCLPIAIAQAARATGGPATWRAEGYGMNSIFRRQNLPLLVTALVFVALFGAFSVCFRNFLSLRVVTNLFMNNAHVGVLAVGLTFVILSGGIDLSVGSVLAFTTILVATLIGRFHVHPVPAIALALAAGTVFGTGQ